MRAALLLPLVATLSCRGAVLDLEFFATEPLTLRTLRVAPTDAERLRFPSDGGAPLSLPLTLRLLVDAEPVSLEVEGIDVEGGVHTQRAEWATLAPGSTQRTRIDLSTTSWCPAPTPDDEIPLYDEGAHGRTLFGYDATRLQERDEVTLACSGARFVEYDARSRFDGLGLLSAAPRAYARLELRLWASAPSQWRVGLGDSDADMAWLPRPDECRLDAAACSLTVGPSWRSWVLEVPPTVPATSRLVLQLDSTASATLRLDDVRAVMR